MRKSRTPHGSGSNDPPSLVGLFIMPLFALANAGVVLDSNSFSLASDLSLGVVLGLVVGKPVGITLFDLGGCESRPLQARRTGVPE